MAESKVYMTYNEFKMCCILFTKNFEGKRYGDIVKDCYADDVDCIISFNSIVFTVNHFGYFENYYLFSYTDMKYISVQLEEYTDESFTNVEDFLNHFNIHSKDIVC